MALLIWPVAGVELVGWSASNNLPHADGFYSADRPLYFVTHFYAHQPDAPFQLTINLKVNNEAIFSLFLNKCAMVFFFVVMMSKGPTLVAGWRWRWERETGGGGNGRDESSPTRPGADVE